MYHQAPESFYEMLQHSPSLFMNSSNQLMRPNLTIPTSHPNIKPEMSSPTPFSPQVFQFPPMRPIDFSAMRPEMMSSCPVLPSYPATSSYSPMSSQFKADVRSPALPPTSSSICPMTSSYSPMTSSFKSEMKSPEQSPALPSYFAYTPAAEAPRHPTYSNEALRSYSLPTAPAVSSPYSLPAMLYHKAPNYPTPPQSPSPSQDLNFNLAQILSSQASYTELLTHIQSSSFSADKHSVLRELWLNAVYTTAQSDKPKKLSSMARHRLRKRFPFPASISVGEETSYNIKASARKTLVSMFELNPYPSPHEKRMLAAECGMEYVQIAHWFKNRRMRTKPGKGKVASQA